MSPTPLQRRNGSQDDAPVLVDLEPAEFLSQRQADLAGSPDLQLAGDDVASLEVQGLGRDAIHAGVQPKIYVHLLQGVMSEGRCPWRLGRQHALGHVDERHLQAGDAGQAPVALHGGDGLVQLGRQLDPRGACTNDADADLVAPACRHLDGGVHQPPLEGAGLLAAVQHVAVLDHARNAEVVHLRAEGQDQRVVGDLAGR